MAYTVISQNNTTTTLQDENGNIIYVPGRVTLATSTNYTISEVNNSTATLTDGSGNVIRNVPCVVVLAGEGGGGGSDLPDQTGHSGEFLTTDGTDASWTAISQLPDQTGYSGRVLGTDGFVAGWVEPERVQRDVMPVADNTNVNKIIEFVGTTDSTYTNGYFYKNIQTASYDSTVTFQAGTLSGATMACSGSDFAAFVAEWGSGDITTITHGTLTYDQSGGLLVFVGKDSEETTVCTFQLYTEDYQDAGFTITGTLQDGDVFAFDTTITESFSYAWTRVDVQPTPEALPDQTGQNGKFLTTNGTSASWGTVDTLPSQTGQSGKFLTTDGTDASWGNALANIATGKRSFTIGGTPTSATYSINVGYNSSVSPYGNSVVIGSFASSAGESAVSIGYYAAASAFCATAIGTSSNATASRAIQIGGGTNNDANTLKVGLNTNKNVQLLSADGTIPTARLTKVNSTITLTAAGWSSNTQTVNVTGMTADGVVMVSPDPTDQSAYTSAGILCTAQAAGTLTFTCDTVPSGDIDVNVVML